MFSVMRFLLGKGVTNDPLYCLTQLDYWIKANYPEKATEILHQLNAGCTPEVAHAVLSAQIYQYRIANITNNTYGDLGNYLNKSAPIWSYQELMELLLKKYNAPYLTAEEKFTVFKTLADRLEDQEFLKSFSSDSQFRPLFNINFYNDFKIFLEKNLENYKNINVVLDEIQKPPQQHDTQFLKKELAKQYKFSEPLTSEQKDMIAISLFLADESLVLKQLKKLENILEKRAGDTFDPKKQKLAGYEDGKEYKHNKLLSNYLYEWAKENGFPGYAKVYQNVDLDLLKSGFLFKDRKTRGVFHGEWIHFIQFWCLVEENKDKHFLSNNPVDLLKWMGTQDELVWNNTFENQENAIFRPTHDARIASQFDRYIQSETGAKEIPAVHQLIKGRHHKEEQKPEPDDVVDYQKFYFKK